MPEIKLKHVVSVTSEDKVHKAENILKSDAFRKWKCANPGENKASVILQFEKASEIYSIDIGNEHSAFIEVLVGRSSDSANDYQVLLGASSFMSPLESRNGTNTNRVRIFGPDKLSQDLRNEKWDCVQVVCTQPFNKNVQYGLSFIKFQATPDPEEKSSNELKTQQTPLTFGAFKLKEDDEENGLTIGSFFSKQKEQKKSGVSAAGPAAIRQASSFAATALASNKNIELKKVVKSPNQAVTSKRKHSNEEEEEEEVITKKPVKKVSSSSTVSRGESSPNVTNVKNKMPVTKSPVTKKVVKKKPFYKIMDKVVFVLSGFQNPLRSDIRDKALEMGAKYKPDWNSSCTHLVCAFINTPKYVQVRGADGRVVKKEWIFDCYKKKTLLPWRDYMLGNYTTKSTDEEEDDNEEEEEEEEEEKEVVMKSKGSSNTSINEKKSSIQRKSLVAAVGRPSIDNTTNKESPSKVKNSKLFNPLESSDDETDAGSDYLANTDVDEEEDDSGGDTEDEIRKVEKQLSEKKAVPQRKKSEKQSSPVKSSSHNHEDVNGFSSSQNESPSKKIDTKDLPLPVLPDIFKNKCFFLYGDFSSSERHQLQRYIIAFNGSIADYMDDKVKYVITQAKWDNAFDEALAENENLVFVRPKWIHKCKESAKFVPYQPYAVVPAE